MLRITLPLLSLPGLAAAHGSHLPVGEAMHGVAHAVGPLLALAIIATLVALVWRRDQ